MRIAVCDDEIAVINQMKDIIEEYAFEKKVIAAIDVYQNGKGLLEGRQCYDLIFLDIDMKDMNGITIAKEIRETDKDVKIIFVTNYTDYQNYAFSVHAFDYLIKPVNRERIYYMLNEVINYSKEDFKIPHIEINTTEGYKNILIEDICYFEYHDRRVKIITKRGTYFLKQSLSQVDSMMSPYGFAIPHKSFLVNLLQVASINGYTIFMMDGSRVPLSQKKSVGFRKQLNSFIEKQITMFG